MVFYFVDLNIAGVSHCSCALCCAYSISFYFFLFAGSTYLHELLHSVLEAKRKKKKTNERIKYACVLCVYVFALSVCTIYLSYIFCLCEFDKIVIENRGTPNWHLATNVVMRPEVGRSKKKNERYGDRNGNRMKKKNKKWKIQI